MHSDQGRFATLLEAHKGIVYKVCRAYCAVPDQLEDLAQEIMLQLWRSFGSFDESRCKFSTWMYRVALNTAISHHRSRKRTPAAIPITFEIIEISADREAEPTEVRMLYAFIERVEPLHRALLLLYLDGNSHQETAAVLGISESNVATKLARLKQRMKEEFR